MNFVKNINFIMKKRGLNEIEFAKACGVSTYKMAKWLSGASVPRLNDFIKLCKALNVKANWLLGLED